MGTTKKGQSNMFWIIIGAVLALVVLIVLLLIFTNTTGDLQDGVSGCAGKGGDCATDDCKEYPGTLQAPFSCPGGDDQVCCLGFGNKDKNDD